MKKSKSLQEHAIPVAKFHRVIAESPSDEKEEYDVKPTPTELKEDVTHSEFARKATPKIEDSTYYGPIRQIDNNDIFSELAYLMNGPTYRFPAHPNDINTLRKSLEVICFFKLLEEEDGDVTIIVGEEVNQIPKSFKAHSLILKTQCPWFKIALSKDWARKGEETIVIRKPNISTSTFEIILK
ncbi:379_t:CDS:2 [Rhizophagus irregularis]|nr:379_t:CDS:2 [Rhizophagus irregularis]